jgi:GxxExxY protein
MILKRETQKIIGACMEVHNKLGHGFAEVLYQDALEVELSSRDIPFDRELKFEVSYKGTVLPHYYYADFVVMGQIIVELKCVKEFTKEHFSQVLNYLKISKCRVGLLFNFSRGSLEWKRLIL